MARRPARPAEESAPPSSGEEGAPDLAPVVGANLRRIRSERSLSLEALARRCGVSRAMLGQIELGQSVPTINVLWKIAHALDLPFSALITSTKPQGGTRVLSKKKTKRLTSHDGSFSSRALFPMDEPRRVEFYELDLAHAASEEADAHAPGTRENLVVVAGEIEIDVGDEVHRLATGDSILFEADKPHVYRNVGESDARMYLVMTYAEPVS